MFPIKHIPLRNAVVFIFVQFQHPKLTDFQPPPDLFNQSPKLHALAPFHFKNQTVSFHSSLTLAFSPGRQKQRHPAFHVGAVGTLRMPSSAPPSLRSLAARKLRLLTCSNCQQKLLLSYFFSKKPLNLLSDRLLAVIQKKLSEWNILNHFYPK